MADIKIFVCCHQENQSVPKNKLLYPIQVGAALSNTRFAECIHDDEGENISSKNASYCELTGQYYVWKNIQADYYGFFHYRRFLYPNAKTKHPYKIEKELSEKKLIQFGYDNFSSLIEQYDMIIPVGEDMHITVREHYARAPFHHEKDFDIAEQVVKDLYPEYSKPMSEYLNGSICYFGNIYIMKRDVFYRYCNWLFSVLAEFDKRADKIGYGPQEQRVDGYIAERLLGIFITYIRSSIKVLELPRVIVNPNNINRFTKRIINFLLPPGSSRRAVVKKYIVKNSKLIKTLYETCCGNNSNL